MQKEIGIKKFTSSIQNSPLLDGDSVEEKEYTNTFSSVKKDDAPSEVESSPVNNVQEPSNVESSYSPPVEESFEPPTSEYSNEPQGMGFDDNAPEEQEISEADQQQAAQMASGSADMLIGLYSSFLPPILGDMAKANIPKIKQVLDSNKQLDAGQIASITEFLQASNQEIEESLKLTGEQVVMLKTALAKVLEQYNLQPTNPIVNLIMVVASIGIMQFMTVKRLIAVREEQLVAFISAYKITEPEGMEGTFSKKIQLEKKQAA